MAADYWTSTQRRHWYFTREALADIRKTLEDEDRHLIQQFPLPDERHLSYFFNQQLMKLGKRMNPPVRQQAYATAQVYIRRFYFKVGIRTTNPYLVVATALYLASKMEECPLHIRNVVHECRLVWPAYFAVSDIARLGEYEFYLISEMNSQMIVHQPYRTLTELKGIHELRQDDVSLAWSVINDHYMTDLPLLYAPHVIAIAAIFLAVTLKPTQAGMQAPVDQSVPLAVPKLPSTDVSMVGASATSAHQKKVDSLVSWLAESEVDITAVMECCQEIISFYECLADYKELNCEEQIARFVRARGLEK